MLQITLQDEDIKNKVRVIMIHFSRLAIPKDKSPLNKVYLDPHNKGNYYHLINILVKTILHLLYFCFRFERIKIYIYDNKCSDGQNC